MAGVAAGADVGAFFSRPLWCSFFSVCEISKDFTKTSFGLISFIFFFACLRVHACTSAVVPLLLMPVHLNVCSFSPHSNLCSCAWFLTQMYSPLCAFHSLIVCQIMCSVIRRMAYMLHFRTEKSSYSEKVLIQEFLVTIGY